MLMPRVHTVDRKVGDGIGSEEVSRCSSHLQFPVGDSDEDADDDDLDVRISVSACLALDKQQTLQ